MMAQALRCIKIEHVGGLLLNLFATVPLRRRGPPARCAAGCLSCVARGRRDVRS